MDNNDWIKEEKDKWTVTRSTFVPLFERIEGLCGRFAFTFEVIPDDELHGEVNDYINVIQDILDTIKDKNNDLGLSEVVIRSLLKPRRKRRLDFKPSIQQT